MKHLNLSSLLLEIEIKHNKIKLSGISLIVICGILSLFALLTGGYMAIPGFLFIIVLILMKLKREKDAVEILKNHREEYIKTAKYPYSEESKLENVIEASIIKKNKHKWPVIISLAFSFVFTIIAGIIGGDVLFYLAMAIYMAAALYFIYFLIFILKPAKRYSKIKEKYDRSLYEDINLEIISTYSINLYCGEKAFFSPYNCRLIPYESVDSVNKHTRSKKINGKSITITELSVYADGKRVLKTQCNPIDIAWLICECIKPINPNVVIEGFGESE